MWFPEEELILKHYTIEELISQTRMFFGSFDGQPTYDDIKRAGLPRFSVVKRLTGKTYMQFISDLGYSMSGTTTIARSKDVMIQDAIDRFKKTGRLPPEKSDGTGIKTMASYRKHFGSVADICKAIGADYSKIEKDNGMFGTLCVDADGNICNSVAEMQFDNYFISKGISFRKEVPYSEIITGCGYLLDWVLQFESKNWYVEYFGLYNENSKDCSISRYTNKAKHKMQILCENGFSRQCIFIYPNDFKNKSMDEIFAQVLSK